MKGPAHHRWSPAGGGGGYRGQRQGREDDTIICIAWFTSQEIVSIGVRSGRGGLPGRSRWAWCGLHTSAANVSLAAAHNLTERCRLSGRATCSRVTDRRPGVSLAAGVPLRRDPVFLLPSGTRRCKTACPRAWFAAPAKPPARNIRNRLVPALRITDGRRGAPQDKFFRWSQKTAFIHPIEAVLADESCGEGRQAKYALKASMPGWFYARPLQRKPERRPLPPAGPVPDPRPGHSLCSVQQGSGRQRAACSNRLCRGLVDDNGFPVTRCITNIPGGVSVNCPRGRDRSLRFFR